MDKQIDETYEQTKERVRRERNLSRLKIEKISNQIQKTLNTFQSDEGVTLVSWDDLRVFTVGEKYPVNSKVYFVKVSQNETEIVFETFMEPGGAFGIQKHDVEEFLKVVYGHLIEPFRDNKVYLKGEFLKYHIGEKHKPKSDIDSKYIVTFKKPLK